MRNSLLAMAILVSAGGLAACGGIGNAQKNLRSAVDNKKPTLDECYAKALERNDKFAGSMTVKLTVGEKTGTVDQVNIVDPGFADNDLQGCVKGALAGVSIDPKPKANLEVEYTLNFTPEAGS